MIRGVALALLVAVGLLAATRLRAEESWSALLARIRATFPDVSQLDVRALHDGGAARTLLVDVREPAEYAVSHLPGARHTQSAADVRAWLAGGSYDRVVVYCSVGYRSAKFVAALQRAGVANVFNLEGSIFAWANAGYPVENSAGATPLVHPFDASWGRFLAPAHRAPLP